MATDIATQPLTSPFSHPSLARLRNALGTMNGKPILMSGFQISAADESLIKRSLSETQERLRPRASDQRQVAVAIGRMITGFSVQDRGAASNITADVYMSAVRLLPGWAVIEACDRFLRGEIVTGGFAPTPPQLCQATETVLRPVLADLANLTQLAAIAEPAEPTMAERGFIEQGFEDLKASLRPPVSDVREAAESGLRKRANDLGIDYATAMAAIPDAPARG